MVKKNRWVNNYSNLEPDDQLIVAEAIVTELRDNENLLDLEDEYNNEKSIIVRKFFELIKQKAKLSQKSKKYEEIFDKYESLSEKNKMKLFDKIYPIILKYYGIQEQENKEEICKQEGHVFDKWKKSTWIEYIDTVIDHIHVPKFGVEHKIWERTCSRCNLVEKTDYVPEEVITERKEKNRIRKIKRLEKELQELKSNK